MPIHHAFKQKEIQPGSESRPESQPESLLQLKILDSLKKGPLRKSVIAENIGHATVSGELNKQVRNLIKLGLIEYTIPEKINSRNQRYRLTEKGNKLGLRQLSTR